MIVVTLLLLAVPLVLSRRLGGLLYPHVPVKTLGGVDANVKAHTCDRLG